MFIYLFDLRSVRDVEVSAAAPPPPPPTPHPPPTPTTTTTTTPTTTPAQPSHYFTNPAAWDDGNQRFARYRIATKLNVETEEIQVNTLIYAMRPEAESAFRTLQFTDDAEKDKYDIVLKKFDDYFKPTKNVIHERTHFNLRSQRPGESVDAFIRTLFDIAETCDFGNNKDELIRDRIVTRLLDKGLSRELQLKSDLTLVFAVQLALNNMKPLKTSFPSVWHRF